MDATVDYQLIINNEKVVELGQSFYIIEEEVDFENVMCDFENFLKNSNEIDFTKHSSLIIKFFESMHDYLKMDVEEQAGFDELFLYEGNELTVEFIHQNKDTISQFIRKWIRPSDKKIDCFFDLSIREIDIEETTEIDPSSTEITIELFEGDFHLEFPTLYKGNYISNQLYIKVEYYEALMNDLKPIFTI